MSTDKKAGDISADDRRLFQLLDVVLDGSCTDAEREQFAQLIERHPRLIGDLVDEVFIHSLLQWLGEDTIDSANVDYAADAEFAKSGQLPGLATAGPSAAGPQQYQSIRNQPSTTESILAERQQPWFVRQSSLWMAAAVLLLIGLTTIWQVTIRWQSDGMPESAVAEIVEQEGVRWSQNSAALYEGRFVNPGRLESTAGRFTMQFRSGPVVRVNGAASMMIESDMLVHLDRGQATTRVPDSMTGFTIKTPVINVIDQGTEFGVAARENGYTDIVVFDGKVDLQDGISSAGTPKRLIQGEAARVDRLGTIERIMQVGRDQKGGWWTADFPDDDTPQTAGNVIREVRDNIPPSDGSKYFCYQITYRGLYDDVRAYADHPHEWNGMDARGLPRFLCGADFLKTFNDYRYLNDFEMVVELSRPANLYVFFDDRVPPPAWLVDQFEDTGIDIGLDEGPWEGIPDHRTEVGAGRSIDNVFSVWLRRCTITAPITLGLMGEETQARAMYGIAATPLDHEHPEPAMDRLQQEL